VLKPIAIGTEWWLKTVDATSAPAEGMHRLAKDAKNLTDMASIPEKGCKALSRSVEFVSNPSLSTFGELLHKVSDLWVPVVDAAKTITSKVAPLCARSAQLLELSGSTALVTAMTFGTLEEVEKINSAEKMVARGGKDQVAAEAQKANSCLTIIRNSSFQGLGVFSLATYFLGAAVPGMLMLMLATNGLAFTIFAEFHKRMVMEPAQKELLPAKKV
jgi:hypothetical protein